MRCSGLAQNFTCWGMFVVALAPVAMWAALASLAAACKRRDHVTGS